MLNKIFLKKQYIKHFGDNANINVTFCPYRLCPLGAHSDHQHGLISGFAINYGIYIAYTINDNALCKCISFNFDGPKTFKVDCALDKENDWADYIRGAVYSFSRHGYNLKYGINAYIHGEIPTGGLSSSAAVIIAFINSLAFANDIKLSAEELIKMSYEAEANFVGMNIGIMDQSCEILSKKNKLLVLDTQNFKYETIGMKKKPLPFEILVIHTGAIRNLASTLYNIRVDEMRSAAFISLSFENSNKEKFKNTYLRDVPKSIFDKYKQKMPDNIRKRAEHFYTEYDRVIKGKDAWQNGDIIEFGKLVSESGMSSIVNYESGSKVLIDLYNIIVDTDGVYGGRFLGGGFNGACLAIIDSRKEANVIRTILDKYEHIHPEYKKKVKTYICTLVDGIGGQL